MILKRSEKTAVLLALASVLCWSGAAAAFKKALASGSPWLVVFAASLISTVVFAVVLFVRKCPVRKADMISGLFLGFLNPFLYYLVLLNAYDGLPAQIAMVVNYLWPVVLVLLSVPFLGQKLNLRGFTGILLSFSGVLFLAFAGRNTFEISTAPLLLAFASTLIWAVYWVLNTRNSGKTAAVLFSSFVSGSVYLLVYGLVTGQKFSFSSAASPWILYIGMLEMGLTYIMWNTALKWTSSTARVSGMIFLTPFLALVFIGIIVGEKIAVSTVAGLLLVTAGILLEKHSRKDSL
ncbi:MAG: DMT family transporter [Candidatus Sabulitectum sp.]|nr:DMT family transporter [Candidatus Sabulitectum sp.]